MAPVKVSLSCVASTSDPPAVMVPFQSWKNDGLLVTAFWNAGWSTTTSASPTGIDCGVWPGTATI